MKHLKKHPISESFKIDDIEKMEPYKKRGDDEEDTGYIMFNGEPLETSPGIGIRIGERNSGLFDAIIQLLNDAYREGIKAAVQNNQNK